MFVDELIDTCISITKRVEVEEEEKEKQKDEYYKYRMKATTEIPESYLYDHLMNVIILQDRHIHV